MKKHITSLIIAAWLFLPLQAQELLVKGMALAADDESAITNERMDLNGAPCALVKVEIGLPDVTFEGLVVGKAPYRDGVYWVYMAQGSKRLKMAASGYLPEDILFADHGIQRLQSRATYRLQLQSPAKQDLEGPASLKITSHPSVARVLIDGRPVGQTPFFAPEYATGLHKIRLEKQGYVDYITSLTLYQGHSEEIQAQMRRLLPARLICNVHDARLWIDDDPAGTVADVDSLSVGSHSITLRKDGYKELRGSVEVAEGEENVFTFNMKKVFSVGGIDFTLIRVDGGTFSREGHDITLSAFHIGQTEVTQEQ